MLLAGVSRYSPATRRLRTNRAAGYPGRVTPTTPTAVLLDAARARLVGAPTEGLGQARSSRWRGARIVPVGQAWHVGALLLTQDQALATGEVLRAAAAVRRGYTAESARARAELRAQARKGGFPEGATVHIGWTVIDVAAVDAGGASGPLALIDGTPAIRWRADATYMSLQAYLDERLELMAR